MCAMSLHLEQYRVPGVGLSAYYVREWITEREEALLVERALGAERARWTALAGRRAAAWGGPSGLAPGRREPLPAWLAALAARLAAAGLPAPDHALVNRYAPGEGILAHKDGARYLPAVCSVSCGSRAVLRLWEPPPPPAEPHALRPRGGLLLEPRSLLVLTRDLYTRHLHSIEPLTHDALDASLHNLPLCAPELAHATQPLPRGTRLSFTLRRVAPRGADATAALAECPW